MLSPWQQERMRKLRLKHEREEAAREKMTADAQEAAEANARKYQHLPQSEQTFDELAVLFNAETAIAITNHINAMINERKNDDI